MSLSADIDEMQADPSLSRDGWGLALLVNVAKSEAEGPNWLPGLLRDRPKRDLASNKRHPKVVTLT